MSFDLGTQNLAWKWERRDVLVTKAQSLNLFRALNAHVALKGVFCWGSKLLPTPTTCAVLTPKGKQTGRFGKKLKKKNLRVDIERGHKWEEKNKEVLGGEREDSEHQKGDFLVKKRERIELRFERIYL